MAKTTASHCSLASKPISSLLSQFYINWYHRVSVCPWYPFPVLHSSQQDWFNSWIIQHHLYTLRFKMLKIISDDCWDYIAVTGCVSVFVHLRTSMDIICQSRSMLYASQSFETWIERNTIFKGIMVTVLRLVGVVTNLLRWSLSYIVILQNKIFNTTRTDFFLFRISKNILLNHVIFTVLQFWQQFLIVHFFK